MTLQPPDHADHLLGVSDSSAEKIPGKAIKIEIIALMVLVGTWLSVAYHYILGVYFGQSYPHNTFLFRPEDRFRDLYNTMEYARQLIAGRSDVIPYSPLSTSLMTMLDHVPNPIARTLALMAFLLVVAVLAWNSFASGLGWSKLQKTGLTFVITTMCYPVLFLADRANEEMFVFMAILAFAYFYFARQSPWAGVFLGLAIAYKIFPGVLVVLLLADRRWRDLAITAATTVGATVVTAFGLGIVSGLGFGGILSGWYKTLFVGHIGYSSTLEAAQHGHSLWGLIVSAAGLAQGGDPTGLSTKAYSLFALTAFLVLTAYVVFFERSEWKRMTLLVIAMVLLPFESHDYTLVHLLVPLMLFLNSRRSTWDTVYAVLFGLVLIPLDYGIVVAQVSTAAFVYPLALALLAVLIIVQRLLPSAVKEVSES